MAGDTGAECSIQGRVAQGQTPGNFEAKIGVFAADFRRISGRFKAS